MRKIGLSDANKNTWLTLEEAAEYLGMGKTVLYTLVREGRIPSSKVGKKWTFEKEQLDSWVRTNQPMETFFMSLSTSRRTARSASRSGRHISAPMSSLPLARTRQSSKFPLGAASLGSPQSFLSVSLVVAYLSLLRT
jgi:excisionase family DNA binding protein